MKRVDLIRTIEKTSPSLLDTVAQLAKRAMNPAPSVFVVKFGEKIKKHFDIGSIITYLIN
jgi:hypothetical protein